MNYFTNILAGASKEKLTCDCFHLLGVWFAEQKITQDQKKYLTEMTWNVDWDDHLERYEFCRLIDLYSKRLSLSEGSSRSEDLSWPEVVGLD